MSRPDPTRGAAGPLRIDSVRRESPESSERKGRQNLADTAAVPERKSAQETPPTESDRLDGGHNPQEIGAFATPGSPPRLSSPGVGMTGWFQRSVVLSSVYSSVPRAPARGAPVTSFMLGLACVILVIGGGMWFLTN